MSKSKALNDALNNGNIELVAALLDKGDDMKTGFRKVLENAVFPSMEKDIEEIQDIAFKEGYIEGLKAFAWWKDGVQYVGTCGTTLEKAINEVGDDLRTQGRRTI